MRKRERSDLLPLSRSAVLLPLALILGGAAPRAPSTALTIAPSTYDWGDVNVGNSLAIMIFKITLPVRASPADAITASVTGANAGDFVVEADPVVTSCYSPLWQSDCVIMVQFSPKAVGLRTATLVVADTRGNRGTAALKGTGTRTFGCRPTEAASCNYGDHYSGYFTWRSEIVVGPEAGETVHTAKRFVDVTATVTKGVAVCSGTMTAEEAESSGGRIMRTSKSSGITQGRGLFAVEFQRNENNTLVYVITAVCPGFGVTTTTFDGSTGGSATVSEAATPARMGSSGMMQSEPEPAMAVGDALIGAKTGSHPDADPANRVTGSLRLDWALLRWSPP